MSGGRKKGDKRGGGSTDGKGAEGEVEFDVAAALDPDGDGKTDGDGKEATSAEDKTPPAPLAPVQTGPETGIPGMKPDENGEVGGQGATPPPSPESKKPEEGKEGEEGAADVNDLDGDTPPTTEPEADPTTTEPEADPTTEPEAAASPPPPPPPPPSGNKAEQWIEDNRPTNRDDYTPTSEISDTRNPPIDRSTENENSGQQIADRIQELTPELTSTVRQTVINNFTEIQAQTNPAPGVPEGMPDISYARASNLAEAQFREVARQMGFPETGILQREIDTFNQKFREAWQIEAEKYANNWEGTKSRDLTHQPNGEPYSNSRYRRMGRQEYKDLRTGVFLEVSQEWGQIAPELAISGNNKDQAMDRVVQNNFDAHYGERGGQGWLKNIVEDYRGMNGWEVAFGKKYDPRHLTREQSSLSKNGVTGAVVSTGGKVLFYPPYLLAKALRVDKFLPAAAAIGIFGQGIVEEEQERKAAEKEAIENGNFDDLEHGSRAVQWLLVEPAQNAWWAIKNVNTFSMWGTIDDLVGEEEQEKHGKAPKTAPVDLSTEYGENNSTTPSAGTGTTNPGTGTGTDTDKDKDKVDLAEKYGKKKPEKEKAEDKPSAEDEKKSADPDGKKKSSVFDKYKPKEGASIGPKTIKPTDLDTDDTAVARAEASKGSSDIGRA